MINVFFYFIIFIGFLIDHMSVTGNILYNEFIVCHGKWLDYFAVASLTFSFMGNFMLRCSGSEVRGSSSIKVAQDNFSH